MKMFKLIYKIVTILLAGVLLTTCDKSIGEIRIDQESKDYCLFAEDSYWIYQDSTTLAIDSVVIDNPIGYRFSRSSGNGYKCETYFIHTSSYFQNNILSFESRLTTSHADPDILKPCLLFGENGISYRNGEIGENFPHSRANTIILVEKKNNYSINGVSYSNVKVFEYNYLGIKRIYYWAKYVGLIREEIYENDSVIVKNLVKYHVKPYNK